MKSTMKKIKREKKEKGKRQMGEKNGKTEVFINIKFTEDQNMNNEIKKIFITSEIEEKLEGKFNIDKSETWLESNIESKFNALEVNVNAEYQNNEVRIGEMNENIENNKIILIKYKINFHIIAMKVVFLFLMKFHVYKTQSEKKSILESNEYLEEIYSKITSNYIDSPEYLIMKYMNQMSAEEIKYLKEKMFIDINLMNKDFHEDLNRMKVSINSLINKLQIEGVTAARASFFEIPWAEIEQSIDKETETLNNEIFSLSKKDNNTNIFSRTEEREIKEKSKDNKEFFTINDFDFDSFDMLLDTEVQREIEMHRNEYIPRLNTLNLDEEVESLKIQIGFEDQEEMERINKEIEKFKINSEMDNKGGIETNKRMIPYNASELIRNNINLFLNSQNFNHSWELPVFDIENYKHYMDTFSSMMEESYIRHIYASNGWMPDTQRDIERINPETGKSFSPDYVLIKGMEVAYVEFKFKYGNWNEQMRREVEEGTAFNKGTIEKYGNSVRVEYLEGDENYIKRNFNRSIYLEPLIKMLQLITILRPLVSRKSPLKNYKMGINQLDQWENTLEQTKETFRKGIVLFCDNNREEEGKNLIKDTILNLPKMGNWIRQNVLFSEDIMDYFQIYIGGNVDPDNPFSRGKSKEFSALKGRIHNHGNKAKNLFMCPQYLTNYEITTEEVRGLIQDDPPIVFTIFEIYNNLTTNNKEMLSRLSQIQKTIAFVEGTATNEVIDKISYKNFGGKFPRYDLLEMMYKQKEEILEKLNEDIKEEGRLVKGQDLRIKLSKRDNLVFSSESLLRKAFNYKTEDKNSRSKEQSDLEVKLDRVINEMKNNTDQFAQDKYEEEVIKITMEIRNLEKNNLFRSRLDFTDSFSIVEAQLPKINVNPDSKPNLEDLRGAYAMVGNERLSKLSDEAVEIAEETLTRVINNPLCKMTFSYYQLLETIKGNINQPHSKYMDRKSFRVFLCPHTLVYIIATPSPNKNTSPALIFFGKTHINDIESLKMKFIFKLGIKIQGDYCFWWTKKPCRLPWITVKNSLKLKWGSIFTAAYALELESDLYTKPLYWSLFWNFTRAMKFCLDTVYLVLKGSFQLASFGKEKANEELNALVTNDVRCSSLMYRLKKNFKDFAIKSYKSSLGKYNQQNYLIDPIFGSKITGWQMLLGIIYIRMVYDKDDESDVLQLYDKSIQKELGLKEDYLNSVGFNNQHATIDQQKDVNDFMVKLFPDGFDNKWVKLAYLPSAIMKYGRVLSKSAKEDFSVSKTHEYITSPVLNTGKNSSVMIPGKLFKLIEVNSGDPDYEALKIKSKNNKTKMFSLPGLNSEKLDIALIKNYYAIKDIISNNGRMMEDKELVMFIRNILFDNIPNINSFFENDNQISLGVSSIIDILIQGGNSVVRMKDKKESKYNRRVFFLQLIGNKTSNQVFDTFYRPLLICKENEVDIISDGGNKKILSLQTKNKKFTMKKNSMSCATDITRFGDQVLSEAMFVLNKALLLENFLTENEYIYFAYLISILQNRKIILPTEMQAAILKETNGTYQINIEKAGKWYAHYKSGPLSAALNDPQNDIGLDGPLLREIKWCLKITRRNGGTLGVFNICWSVLSSMYVMMQKDIMKELFVNPIVMEGSTMSDDNLTQTIFELPSRESFFNEGIIDRFLEKFYNNNLKILIDGKNYYSIHNETKEKVLIKRQENPELIDAIAQTYLSTAILCPRMFSWLISTLKTTFGSAAEIMQTIITNSGKFFVPITRYITSMFVELTGENPTYDTMNSVSKVYDILVNGGSTQTVIMGFILANTMVSERFGLKNRKINLPLQLNGIYFIYPDLMITTGFDGNTLRLLQASEKNKELEKVLAVLIDSPEIFRQKTNNRQIANDEMAKINTINKESKRINKYGIENNYKRETIDPWEAAAVETEKIFRTITKIEDKFTEDIEVMGDCVIDREEDNYEQTNVKLGLWVVFSIKFNRNIKAKSAYQEFRERIKGDIAEFAQRNYIIYSNEEELEERVIEEVGLLSSLKSSSNLLAVINQLAKMRRPNYADLFGKMSTDYLSIARWGYPERLVNNPFAESIKEKFNVKDDYMRLTDVFNSIMNIARDAKEEDISRSLTIIRIMKNVNKSQLSIFNREFTFTIQERIMPLEEHVFKNMKKEDMKAFIRSENDGFEDTNTIYVETANTFDNINYTNMELQLAISILREKESRKQLEIRRNKNNVGSDFEINDLDTLAYRLFPSVVISKDFQNCVSFVRTHFLQLNIKTPSDMGKYSRTFLKMLTPGDFKGIYKRGFVNNIREEEHFLYDHSKFFFSFRYRLKVEYKGILSDVYRLNDNKFERSMNHYEPNNILICCLWSFEFGLIKPEEILKENISLLYSGINVKNEMISEMALTNILFKIDIRRLGEWSSCVYTKFLMLKSLYQYNFIISAKNDVEEIEGNKRNIKVYYFKYRNWPQILITIDKESKSKEKFKLFMSLGERPNMMNPWEYAKSIAYFITRIFGVNRDFFMGIISMKSSKEISLMDNITGTKKMFKFGNLKYFPDDGKNSEITEKNNKHFAKFNVKEFHLKTPKFFTDNISLNIKVLEKRITHVGLSYQTKNEQIFGDTRLVGNYLVTPWIYSNIGFGTMLVRNDNEKLIEDLYITNINITSPILVSRNPFFTEYETNPSTYLIDEMINLLKINIYSSNLEGMNENVQITKIIRRFEEQTGILYFDLMNVIKERENIKIEDKLDSSKIMYEIGKKEFEMRQVKDSENTAELHMRLNIMRKLINNANRIFNMIKDLAFKQGFRILESNILKNYLIGFVFKSSLEEILLKINNEIIVSKENMQYTYKIVMSTRLKRENLIIKCMNELKLEIKERNLSDFSYDFNKIGDITIKVTDVTLRETESISFIRNKITEYAEDRGYALNFEKITESKLKEKTIPSAVLDAKIKIMKVLNNMNELNIYFNREENIKEIEIIIINIIKDEMYDEEIFTDLNKHIQVMHIHKVNGINNLDPFIIETVIREHIEDRNRSQLIRNAYNTFFIREESGYKKFRKHLIIYDKLMLTYIFDSISNINKNKLSIMWKSVCAL